MLKIANLYPETSNMSSEQILQTVSNRPITAPKSGISSNHINMLCGRRSAFETYGNLNPVSVPTTEEEMAQVLPPISELVMTMKNYELLMKMQILSGILVMSLIRKILLI